MFCEGLLAPAEALAENALQNPEILLLSLLTLVLLQCLGHLHLYLVPLFHLLCLHFVQVFSEDEIYVLVVRRFMLKLGVLLVRVQHVLLLELHQEALIVVEEDFAHDAVPFNQID